MADSTTVNLRSLFIRGRLTMLGVANALAARVVEDAGFEAVYISGAGVTNTDFAIPDLGFIGVSDLCRVVEHVRSAVDLPILVDCDTGFGNELTAFRAAQRLKSAGADGIQLEDQVFPKRCGHFDGTEVVDTAQHLHILQAAREGLGDGVLVARTDAIATEGVDSAISRVNRYLTDGTADVAFVEGPRDVSESEAIPKGVQGPVLLNVVLGGKTPIESLDRIWDMGFASALFANLALQASVKGMQDAFAELVDGRGPAGLGDWVVDFKRRQHLVNKSFYDDFEDRYAQLP